MSSWSMGGAFWGKRFCCTSLARFSDCLMRSCSRVKVLNRSARASCRRMISIAEPTCELYWVTKGKTLKTIKASNMSLSARMANASRKKRAGRNPRRQLTIPASKKIGGTRTDCKLMAFVIQVRFTNGSIAASTRAKTTATINNLSKKGAFFRVIKKDLANKLPQKNVREIKNNTKTWPRWIPNPKNSHKSPLDSKNNRPMQIR